MLDDIILKLPWNFPFLCTTPSYILWLSSLSTTLDPCSCRLSSPHHLPHSKALSQELRGNHGGFPGAELARVFDQPEAPTQVLQVVLEYSDILADLSGVNRAGEFPHEL